MPSFPDLFADPNTPSGRFNPRPAVALGVPETVWNVENPGSVEEIVRQEFGAWLLEEHPELGDAEAVDSSIGRGASGWIPVVQWLGEAIADGVIDLAKAVALAVLLDRLRRRRLGEEGEEQGRERVERAHAPVSGVYVSRGAAALLAAADVATEFDEEGPLEVEAVEEPSGIAGIQVPELSYVGFEPWICLLRNRERELRYVVVVMPDGSVAGRLCVPFLPFEEMYMHPSTFGQS